ncbi:MAG: glycosyltransferase family 4 protein [Fulvivirga sp.]|nr:glycosyltransferase family 4 protein [Fulvivirga sp.]
MKKVLIITYYWPPSGGSGVQRWVKHVKYLPEYGWEPLVFTPENPSFEVKDNSLLDDIPPGTEVIKLPIWEPYQLINKLKGKTNQQTDLVRKQKPTLFNKLMRWLRGNLFIPDPRIFWVKPAVKILNELVFSNNIEVIITTGPPHSMHLIGSKLKKKHDIQWLADFRDPWSQWELFDNFYLSGWAKRRHKHLEQRVLRGADAVVSVSRHYASDLEKLGNRPVHVITNGFDEEEFQHVEAPEPDEFILRHVGVVDELRDPRPVLNAIKKMAEKGEQVKMEFVGNINQTLKAEVNEDELLRQCVSFKDYVPHSEVVKLYKSSAALLIVLADSRNAKGNIPGKLFEYLASGRPILAVGDPTGDTAHIIKETGAGQSVSRNVEDIVKALRTLRSQYKEGQTTPTDKIKKYSRKNLAGQLAKILDEI